MLYRFTYVFDDLGHIDQAEDNMEAIVDAFNREVPRAGAVAGAHVLSRTLSVTLAAEGSTPDEARAEADRFLAMGMAAADLRAPEPVRVEVEPVD